MRTPHFLIALRCLLGLLAVAALAAVAGCADDPTPTPTATPPHGLPPLSLPADEAPHDFLTEWWYFNLHLSEEGGPRRFALHYVLFQVQEQASGRTLYVAQAGLTEAGGGHRKAERFRTTEQPLPGRENGFDFTLGDWQFAGADGETFTLRGDAEDVAFDLALTDVAGALLHDDDGLVDFDEAGLTYYYTRPRLDVTGVVTLPSGAVDVTGLAWYDKQWGDFQPVAVSWDWASIQLDDGRSLMLTRLFDADGAPLGIYGTLQRSDGQVERLATDEFVFEPLPDSAWTSPLTGGSYDTLWRARIPSEDLDATLVPIADALISDAEFRSNALGVVYWEAGVDVLGNDGARIGQGFVELAGRAGLSVP